MVYIIEAAIKDHDGTIYTVPRPGRHHHVIGIMVEAGRPTPISGEQGFLTNEGNFVDRIEAKKIAREAGQLLPTDRNLKILFSEDLW